MSGAGLVSMQSMTDRAVAPLMRSVRDNNLSTILQALLQSNLARKQLAATTKIGFGTITRLVAALLDAGYIEEAPVAVPEGRAAGRPEVPLRLRGTSGKLVIGAQIHARLLTVDVLTLSGEKVASEEIPHGNSNPGTVIRSAVTLARRVASDFPRDRLIGVGISTGGQVDFDSGRLISSPQLGWTDVDLHGPFHKGLELPAVVDSSVRSLAVDRRWWTTPRHDNILVIVVAGAISSAMVIGGELYRGSGATAGDISHFPVFAPAPIPCTCSTGGCASSTLTDLAVHQSAVNAGLVDADTSWHAIYDDSPRLAKLRRERARRLGETVGRLMDIVDPAWTIVAGRVGTAEDVEECLSVARRTQQGGHAETRTVSHWQVAEHEWGAGAAALVLDDFLHRPTTYDETLM